MLTRIQTTLKAIKRILLEDEQVKKLLYNDSNNALNLPTPDKQVVEKYVTTCPVYEFDDKEDYTQHGMINCFVVDLDTDDEMNIIGGVLRVNVVYNTDKWELVDGNCRVLSICSRIIELLNNKKFTISNPISFDSMVELILSKKLVGYTLLFNIVDGNSEIENF